MLETIPTEVINMPTTGSQPRGYTTLHLACDGSDRMLRRAHLVSELLLRGAILEARTSNGNTPLLLATGVGIVDTVKVLVAAGADVHAVQERGCGAAQKAYCHSHQMRQTLRAMGVLKPKQWAPYGRQRGHTISDSRQARFAMNGGSETNYIDDDDGEEAVLHC